MYSVAREKAVTLLRAIAESSCSCPAHSVGVWTPQASAAGRLVGSSKLLSCLHKDDKDYAFQIHGATMRYGEGVTREVGMDFVNMGIRRVLVLTDKNVARLPPLKAALDSLHCNEVDYKVYDDVCIEPTNESYEDVIQYVRANSFDGFLAVGGGSAMDTGKVANLFSCCPERELLDFANPPIGRGMPIKKKLKPYICVPTTSGSSSECTDVAVVNYKPKKVKIGIRQLGLKPLLGLVDPLNMQHMPRNVTAFSGFDMLCHCLESFTGIPYTERSPQPRNPNTRPVYQGSNPLTDVWAKYSLDMCRRYFKRSVLDAEDREARYAMALATVGAGNGLNSAGVHLPHGMSYPIAGGVKHYSPADYNTDKALVPHGLAVVMTSPAVFSFTAPTNPQKHLEAAELLGADTTNTKLADAGLLLSDTLRKYMQDLGVVDGLSALGYTREDVPSLVKGTLPQKGVTALSPRPAAEEHLAKLFEDSLNVY